MDERFEDPSDEVEEEDAVADEETMETSVESEAKDRETGRRPKIDQISRGPLPRPIVIRRPVRQERQMTSR